MCYLISVQRVGQVINCWVAARNQNGEEGRPAVTNWLGTQRSLILGGGPAQGSAKDTAGDTVEWTVQYTLWVERPG
jgi:hypothetical protein